MSTLFNCSTVLFGDQSPVGTMNSSSFESATTSPESSQESAVPMSFATMTMNLRSLLAEASLNNGEPFLKVIEEPVEKFRFRYKSEMMGTHGSILARSHERNRRKIYPSVKLCNYDGPAIVRCSLYTAQPSERLRTPHTHRLIVRDQNNMDKDDPHEIIVSQDNSYTAIFHGMGIIHTAKKNIVEELIKKKRSRRLEELKIRNINITSLNTAEETQLKQDAEDEARKMNLNSVSLCFEAFIRDTNNCLIKICQPIFSKPINNMKSALTGELKICRIDKHVSSCMGGEEVFILVEKVGKKNIKIKFFELSEDDQEIWYDYGKFSELDVHHQYAIVFRTPPYRDLDIEKTVDVYLQLYRPTDGDCSEPIRFQYKPSEKMGRTRKRQRVCNESLSSIDKNTRLLNGINAGSNGTMDLGIDLKNATDIVVGSENFSLSDLLNEETGMDSSEFHEFMNNLSISELNLPQTQYGCGGSVGTEISKPVKYDVDPACTGAFILNPSDIPFAGGVKTEGIIACDYMRTFDEQVNFHHDIACDGAALRPTSDLIAETVSEKTVNSIEDEVKSEHEDEPIVKRETMGDYNLLQKALTQLNTVLQEKLPTDVAAGKIDEIFNMRNTEGESAIHAAIMTGQKDAMKLLLQVVGKAQNTSAMNSPNLSAETPLHLAVLHNRPEFIKMLLIKGADENCINRDGNTPIHLAIHCGHNECLAELLDKTNYIENDHKPKYDERNYEGQAPLHLGALKGNLFAVKRLIESGANVNAVDSTFNRHVLLVAVQEGHKDIVEYLVKETNVDVNLANNDGNTPLHYACVVGGGNKDICQLLIDAKADPLQANHEQRSKAAELTAALVIKEEIESEDEFQLRIDDDEEEDEEEEEDEDESSQGMTSMDLARNKKEILEILQKADQYMARTLTQEECEIEVKEEDCESSSDDSTTADNGLFDDETLGKLCMILDRSGKWAGLAELLEYTFLVASIKNATSPSKLLFNYADLHGNTTVLDIRNNLEALGEKEALEVVDLMLARQHTNTEEPQ